MRIFTGAPLPKGADTVVMQEDTTRKGQSVSVQLGGKPGRHVRVRAEDVTAGSSLLSPGTVLGPGEIGLLAGQHHAVVTVRRRRVCIG